MSDLISRKEAIEALGDIHPLDYSAQAYKAKITAIPSADILEHARAIKEYCEEHLKKPYSLCDDCPMFERVCRRFNAVPRRWDLPEEKKGGE